MFGSSSPPVVCRTTHVLFTLFMLAWICWCPAHIMLCCFSFLCLVWPMLPVSLECSFVIVFSVFSNVYFVFEYTWWKLCQKCVARTKLIIYWSFQQLCLCHFILILNNRDQNGKRNSVKRIKAYIKWTMFKMDY